MAVLRPVFYGLFLGLVCLLTLPWIHDKEVKAWALREPYYGPPVAPTGTTLFLRSDAYGKGYFAASRSGGRIHTGIDLKAPVGASIFAAKSGRVTAASFDKGYGYFVEIRHHDGLYTRYAHLSAVQVIEGQWVKIGQPIGKCGKSGNADHPSIVPHLHFEIRYLNHALNPSDRLLDPRLKLAR
jgi:murein DD-endopeptidase MepM/ murein hydrolase activator NlpD